MHGINMSKITDIIDGLEAKELEKKRNQDTYGNTLGIYLWCTKTTKVILSTKIQLQNYLKFRTFSI